MCGLRHKDRSGRGSCRATQRLANRHRIRQGRITVVDGAGAVSHLSIFAVDEDGNLSLSGFATINAPAMALRLSRKTIKKCRPATSREPLVAGLCCSLSIADSESSIRDLKFQQDNPLLCVGAGEAGSATLVASSEYRSFNANQRFADCRHRYLWRDGQFRAALLIQFAASGSHLL